MSWLTHCFSTSCSHKTSASVYKSQWSNVSKTTGPRLCVCAIQLTYAKPETKNIPNTVFRMGADIKVSSGENQKWTCKQAIAERNWGSYGMHVSWRNGCALSAFEGNGDRATVSSIVYRWPVLPPRPFGRIDPALSSANPKCRSSWRGDRVADTETK